MVTLFVLTPSLQTCNGEGNGISTTLTTLNRGACFGGTVLTSTIVNVNDDVSINFAENARAYISSLALICLGI